MKTLRDLLKELKKTGTDDLNFGNSKEKSFGRGIIYAINEIQELSNPKRTRKEIREAIKKIKIKRELKQ